MHSLISCAFRFYAENVSFFSNKLSFFSFLKLLTTEGMSRRRFIAHNVKESKNGENYIWIKIRIWRKHGIRQKTMDSRSITESTECFHRWQENRIISNGESNQAKITKRQLRWKVKWKIHEKDLSALEIQDNARRVRFKWNACKSKLMRWTAERIKH